jgi:deoxyribonuclease V
MRQLQKPKRARGGGAPADAGTAACAPSWTCTTRAPTAPGRQPCWPPLRAVLPGLTGLGLPVVDGYAALDPDGRLGLGAHAHAKFGIPMMGVAKSRYRTAIHAVPDLRGSSARPLFVTAAGMPPTDATDLVRRMTGRYPLPDALRGADALARAGPPAASLTGRQPG